VCLSVGVIIVWVERVGRGNSVLGRGVECHAVCLLAWESGVLDASRCC
jgi:hypothetical protein